MVKNNFRKELLGLFVGIVGGYIIGIAYIYLFAIVNALMSNNLAFKDALLLFLPKFSEFFILKDRIVIFNQVISTIFGLLIGYNYKNKKLIFIFSILLLSYYILFILFWYIFWTKIVGGINEI